MSIKTRIIVNFILVALLPLFFVVLLNYSNARHSLIDTQSTSLNLITDFKASVLENYFADLQHDVAVVRDDPTMKANLPIVARFAGDHANPQYLNAKAILDRQLGSWLKNRSEIVDIMLTDAAGQVVYAAHQQQQRISENPDNRLLPGPGNADFQKEKEGIYTSDIFSDTIAENFSGFLVTAPITNANGTFGGVAAFEVNAQKFYGLIVQNYAGLGQTGETLLARGDTHSVTFINPFRFNPYAPFRSTVEQNSGMETPMFDALVGGSGSGISTDYRGNEVLAAWHPIPSRGWGLETKIDLDEVLLPARVIGYSALIIGFVTTLVLIGAAFLFSQSILAPLESLTAKAGEMAQGNLRVSLEKNLLDSGDETGTLSRAFATMAEKLRELYEGLETKVRERTRDLEQAKATDEAMLASIGDGLAFINPEGRVILLNGAAEHMLGWKNKETLGKKFEEVVKIGGEENEIIPPEHSPVSKVLRSHTSVSTTTTDPYRYTRRDGTTFPVAMTISKVSLQNSLLGLIIVFRDITIEKDIDRAKTEFVSLASHQLRTPLSTINWYAEMLLAGDAGKLNEEQKKYLEEVYKGNRRMVELVNALLNVSRLELGTFTVEPEPTDIAALARSVLDEQKPAIDMKKLTLKPSFPKDLPKITVDPKLLRMVFQNLVANSVKYTNEGGHIGIAVSSDKANNELHFTVSDSGIGIPKNQQKNIFAKLFRADNARESDADGTGLGLYIVKSIIEHSGGTIRFESEENKGTAFYVALPMEGMEKKVGTKSLS